MSSLENKVAVVTGGASGIGLEISRQFALKGAVVHIFELNKAQAEREADLIIANGGMAYSHQVDVSNGADVKNTVAKISSKYAIDILVNNAGIPHIGTVESTTEEDMDRLYATNIKGVFNCIQHCIPLMIKNGGGSIINMCSVAATVGIPERFAYSMTKGAVLTMTYQVAKDYVLDGIRCNSISPARVHTPLVDSYLKKNYPGKEEEVYAKLAKTQPIGRMAQAHEIASMAVYLASHQAAFITGTDFPIDGGFIRLNTP